MDLIPNSIKYSEFLSILYGKQIREFRKRKLKIGDRVRISKYILPFRKGFEAHFTQEVFEIVAIFPRKPPTYTIKDEQDEIIRGNFNRKSWSKSINSGTIYNRVGFKCICTTISRRYTEFFTNALQERVRLESQWEVAISEISYESGYQNLTDGKFMSFDEKFSKSSEFYYLEPSLYPSITDIVEAKNTLIQEIHNHSESSITVKVSRGTQRSEIYHANEGSGLAFFSTDLGHFFNSKVGNESGVM